VAILTTTEQQTATPHDYASPALGVNARFCRGEDRGSVILGCYLDGTNDVGVQGGKVIGGDPVLEDGPPSDLMNLILVQE
jgi:hypothetical protein